MESRLIPPRRVSLVLGAAALAALAGMAGPAGCSKHQQIRTRPTPELWSLHARPTDANNQIAVTANENWRMFWEDMGRLWLLDRPTRLTPAPVPH